MAKRFLWGSHLYTTNHIIKWKDSNRENLLKQICSFPISNPKANWYGTAWTSVPKQAPTSRRVFSEKLQESVGAIKLPHLEAMKTQGSSGSLFPRAPVLTGITPTALGHCLSNPEKGWLCSHCWFWQLGKSPVLLLFFQFRKGRESGIYQAHDMTSPGWDAPC